VQIIDEIIEPPPPKVSLRKSSLSSKENFYVI
jgi:hypothetical protein